MESFITKVTINKNIIKKEPSARSYVPEKTKDMFTLKKKREEEEVPSKLEMGEFCVINVSSEPHSGDAGCVIDHIKVLHVRKVTSARVTKKWGAPWCEVAILKKTPL